MGKLVKYCAKCEEGFAAKFVFCPNCGEHMDAFEMNPIQEEAAPVNTFNASSVEAETSAPATFATAPLPEEPVVAETFSNDEVETFSNDKVETFSDDEVLELDSVDVSEETIEEPETDDAFLPETVSASAAKDADSNGHEDRSIFGFGTSGFNYSEDYRPVNVDDSYRPTVIEEKDTQLRNTLLAGFGTLFVAATILAWLISLFVHALPVFALDEPDLFAFVGPIEPDPVVIEEIKQKNDDDGGGGGGGGKENPIPVNKGRLPTQMENPPNQLLTVTQMSNPTFLVMNATQGKNKREMTNEPIGLPNGLSADTLSGGPGSGGGIGGGRGSGAGGGIGTGEGNGNGSGSGNGNGNGNGDGDGDGDGTPQITKKVVPVGVTEGIKILSRPQPRYTDAARQNNVQGTVTLRVTFLANGSIGGVSPVNGLPYGLTEQAIAAAKQIRFDPPKRNGQAYAVTKTVTYTFTIY